MNLPPVIHIGYHKTGTSYLQKNVFENNANLFYRVPQSEIRDALILPSPLRYDPLVFKEICTDGPPSKRLVISNEYLSSNIHNGDFHSITIAGRLKMTLPSAKVIIGVREQVSMIFSAYSQYIKARGSLSITEYLCSPLTKRFSFDHLQYHQLVAYYVELYGKENVLILPYEILKSNPKLYLKTVFDFIGEYNLINGVNFDIQKKVNPSMSPLTLQVKRFFNPFIMKSFPGLGKTFYFKPFSWLFSLIRKTLKVLPLGGLDRKVETRIYSKILEKTSDKYERSNAQLQNHTPFDLKALGYRL
ncbi:MAG: sulfotransferase [Saprospiraceae bacterium]|nr:sulfotransferase [Lewinella sp.]